MKIPSPRPLIQIVALSVFAGCLAVGMVIVTVLIAIVVAVEMVIDMACGTRRRT